MIARLTFDAADRARPACFVGLAASIVLLVLSVTVLQLPPPMITFALTTLAFAAAPPPVVAEVSPDGQKAQRTRRGPPIIPPDLRKKPRRPVNSDVGQSFHFLNQ